MTTEASENLALGIRAIDGVGRVGCLAGVQDAPRPRESAPPARSALAPARHEAAAPKRWIAFGPEHRIAVVDGVSGHLLAASVALGRCETWRAAEALRQAAAELRAMAVAVAQADDNDRPDDETAAHGAAWRLASSAVKLGAAASTLDRMRAAAPLELQSVVDRSGIVDIDYRWIAAPTHTWYPLVAEPQRHFVQASELSDRDRFADELFMACAYLRLERARASGYPRTALDWSITELNEAAANCGAGRRQPQRPAAEHFGVAELALSMAYRARASEAWTHGKISDAACSFSAASQCLASAAQWLELERRAEIKGAIAAVAQLGERMLAGHRGRRDEVIEVMKVYGRALQALRLRIAPDRARPAGGAVRKPAGLAARGTEGSK